MHPSVISHQSSVISHQLVNCQLSTVIRIYSGFSIVAHFSFEIGTGRMPVPQEWQ
ncbi:MAG: hypothetical protein JGK01_28095 [Microcoleus sp. PH2017_03_ELD_O_A]|uniref:hypothetical protein n=1 Tax=unclassified Microcoleus TaxID=2642155 RepID=UPI001DB80D79|nr:MULTISPECIES: hypothetical protein [unclassified Microcoleus]MCC3445453.1 hypothetical protein [Microcoleus sp. PH2017_03_ELD_O_A]MCC3448916.1 hypothetical protein [Microcoleus sp. PH2017_09_SFU_O_A]MCC3512424.1 hypothetical protein [Microcoleus sp. PH2017_17_BER_D_A]MCC3550488.1 hypothetical protein [Microcoleus sp. PH2017_24_DOB_U_A]MCC3569328.1 hypothetical protein [Microcoleus sp. PH2017_31_RDM_U_A]MCC3623799.1 hypothetical protein [Microcoleus sp. PH2017_36_ELK_O_B]